MTNVLKENLSSIFFENDYIKVVIDKIGGKVSGLINKMTDEDALGESEEPWFTYLADSEKKIIKPSTLSIDGERLKVEFENGIVAFYIIDVKECYFSVTLDSDIPSVVDSITLCNLTTNAYWELDNENAFGLSAVPMTTTVEIFCNPGGAKKYAKGTTYTYLGVSPKGSKIGIAFSRMTEHRDHLKALTDDIDPTKGITSKHGGAYTLDHTDIFGDYVLVQRGITPYNVEKTLKYCKQYSVEQIDMHRGPGTFIQADFDFRCARTPEEEENNTFVSATTFKERMGDRLVKGGVQLSLHTYSSLVPYWAEKTLSNPKWNKQLVMNPKTWTLKEDLSTDATELFTECDSLSIQYNPDQLCPYRYLYTRFLLIDDEILILNSHSDKGFGDLMRGQAGTTPAFHKKGAEIKQFFCWFGMFQSVPLSELFYHVARETARAYNEGGFEMIYLDGLESFARPGLCDMRQKYYIYAEFVREVVSNCKVDPIIEYSSMYPSLWAARGRGGAIDYMKRGYKAHKQLHIESQSKFLNCFYTATVGWFHYAPDMNEKYKDTLVRTMYRDDLDHMGALALAYNFGTVCQPFSIQILEEPTRLSHNFMYYGSYTRLREANYFSPEVKKQLLDGNEHKLFKQSDGSWAFKEMKYLKNKVFDTTDKALTTFKSKNPYGEQTPFIRIEQRYSTDYSDAFVVYPFDETKPVSEIAGTYPLKDVSIKDKIALRLKVHGNSSDTDAILITIFGITPGYDESRIEYFVPVNFEGWKEIILLEANNAEYSDYVFEGVEIPDSPHNLTFPFVPKYDAPISIMVSLAGKCEGVKIGTLTANAVQNASIKNPSVTIGDNTIKFDAELNSADYIEYYPEYDKAYLNYYTKVYDEEGKWMRDNAHTKEITFTGNVKAPEGSFNYTYNAEPTTSLKTRAQVVMGFAGNVIANPSDWKAPEVDMPDGIEKVTLY